MNYSPDGRCYHCGEMMSSGGCPRCTSSRTFCACGALVVCGCGVTFTHPCPGTLQISATFTSIGFTRITTNFL